MELIIIIAIIAIIVMIILMPINIKKMKKIAINSELNEIAKKYPENIKICEEILLKLKNTKTKIEENKDSESTVYVALQDKIYIGNTHESFTRIQTIAHECLHSVQDRKMLIFNFLFSNIYLIYFLVICILVICKRLQNELLYSNILLIFSFIYYAIRVFLENDAMIKAEYLSKEYLYEKKISSNEEIEKIQNGFKEINRYGIIAINSNLFIKIMVKLIIFNLLALIF